MSLEQNKNTTEVQGSASLTGIHQIMLKGIYFKPWVTWLRLLKSQFYNVIWEKKTKIVKAKGALWLGATV